MRHIRAISLASLPLLSLAVGASGQTAASAPESSPNVKSTESAGSSASQAAPAAPAAESSLLESDPRTQLKVDIAPYIWMTNFSGDVTIRGIQFDADISFADILEDSDSIFGLIGAIEFEYDRLLLQFNGAYAKVKFDDTQGFLRDGTVNADIEQSMGWYELFGGYRFLDRPIGEDRSIHRRLTLDGFVGGRYTDIDVDATISVSDAITLPEGGVINVGETRERDASESWFEPFVGGRFGIDFSERWHFVLRGDVGGFGISGAQFAWQTVALLGYHWEMDGWTLAAFGGFRALGQDYSSDGFGWDMVTYGPVIGVRFGLAF